MNYWVAALSNFVLRMSEPLETAAQAAPTVKREAEEDWGGNDDLNGRDLTSAWVGAQP